MRTPSSAAIERAMTAALQLRAELGDTPDARLITDVLEGGTDVFETIDRLAECAIADGMLAEVALERAKRLEKRSDTVRDVISNMLQALDLGESLERGWYTASLSHRSHVIVTDQTKLPPSVMRLSPDKVLLGKLLRKGDQFAGATLSNPEPSVTLRTR